jgi:hypothetical protein
MHTDAFYTVRRLKNGGESGFVGAVWRRAGGLVRHTIELEGVGDTGPVTTVLAACLHGESRGFGGGRD